MLGFNMNDNGVEDDIYQDHKKKMKMVSITFGIIAFILFNLIMYLMITA